MWEYEYKDPINSTQIDVDRFVVLPDLAVSNLVQVRWEKTETLSGFNYGLDAIWGKSHFDFQIYVFLQSPVTLF